MIIVDSGYFVALADVNDAAHEQARALAPSLEEGWITTWPVLTESCYFLGRRVELRSAIGLLDDIVASVIDVWNPPPSAYARVPELMRRYADLPMDLADASLVLLAEHLGHGRILSTDRRDFRTYRFKNRKPFQNLMEPLP